MAVAAAKVVVVDKVVLVHIHMLAVLVVYTMVDIVEVAHHH